MDCMFVRIILMEKMAANVKQLSPFTVKNVEKLLMKIVLVSEEMCMNVKIVERLIGDIQSIKEKEPSLENI